MKAFGRLAHQACLGFIAVVLLLVSAMPSKALPVDTYAPDPAFPWHGFNPNAFGVSLSPPHQSNLGQKIAKLSDGTLVASLVKKLDGSQDNGLWNLGLTRYDSITGYALAWPNRTAPYLGVKPWDIVYPNTASVRFNQIQSLEVIDGRILVAISEQFVDTYVKVLVFGEDGSLKKASAPFSWPIAQHRLRMAAYQTDATIGNQIIRTTQVVMTSTRATDSRPFFMRFKLDAGGALIDETGMVTLTAHDCAISLAYCEPVDMSLGTQQQANVPPKIYILNRVIHSTGIGFQVTRIEASGVADPSWNGQTFSWHSQDVLPVAMAVRNSVDADDIYLLTEMVSRCRNAALIAVLDDAGEWRSSVLFGGSDESNPAACATIPNWLWTSMALDGDRLTLAGFVEGNGNAGQDMSLAIFNTQGGLALENGLQVFGYEDNTQRYGHCRAWDVIAGAAGHFILAGDIRNLASEPDGLAGKIFSAILGLRPERIFRDGLEPAP